MARSIFVNLPVYEHGFQDPDGHIRELVHMEPAALTREPA
jgi:predicted lactoylglutathione lyase